MSRGIELKGINPGDQVAITDPVGNNVTGQVLASPAGHYLEVAAFGQRIIFARAGAMGSGWMPFPGATVIGHQGGLL